MKKSQKRQKRLVLVAMVLMIGLVAGMGAMTYSKYISTTTVPTQNATAAKWGFTVTANADNLFGKNYTGTGLAAVVDPANGLSVKASADKDIVAPGTKGSMTISISGQAEVAAQLTVDFKNAKELFLDLNNNATFDAGTDYAPVKWTLKKGETILVNAVTLAEVETALEGISAVIAPNGDPATFGTYTLSWAWDFGDGSTDINDSILGFIAAGKDADFINNALKIDTVTTAMVTGSSTSLIFDLSINIEQTQVDAP